MLCDRHPASSKTSGRLSLFRRESGVSTRVSDVEASNVCVIRPLFSVLVLNGKPNFWAQAGVSSLGQGGFNQNWLSM